MGIETGTLIHLMNKEEDATNMIDELGRITLPVRLMQQMKWMKRLLC